MNGFWQFSIYNIFVIDQIAIRIEEGARLRVERMFCYD